MTSIQLPRALEAYFAFAELPVTERGRHFTITFTYMEGARLDRLQWWWQVNRGQERGGEPAIATLRQEAIQRFRQHIERWLTNSQRCLRGGEPFPLLEPLIAAQAPAEPAAVAPAATPVELPRSRARVAAGG